ncbi:MAG: hypothetical protein HQL56_07520 [Magnetococcales bacterium]|nr:hypothetical protein [Magnetococcales bacterium]
MRDQRRTERQSVSGRGLLIQGSTQVAVELRDRGPWGFGVVAASPVRTGAPVTLRLPRSDSSESYFCLAPYCQPHSDRFHVGLRILSLLPEGI